MLTLTAMPFFLFVSLSVTTEQSAQDAVLRNNVHNASKIVVGKVIRITPEPLLSSGRVSEHTADWRVAVVRVSKTLKGCSDREISVVFPASFDVMWASDVKLKKGQEAVFLLSDYHVPPSMRVKKYFYLPSPTHLQPKVRAQEISQILKPTQTP